MAEPYHPMLRRRGLLGAAAETTPGTDVYSSITTVLAATKVLNPRMELIEVYDGGANLPASPYGGTRKAQQVSARGRLTFQIEVANGDQTQTLLQGCGFALATGVNSPKTDMSSKKTFSFKLWQDGSLKEMYGASGNCVFTAERGKTLMADFTFDGVWTDPPSDASLPTESLPSSLPFPVRGVAHTVDSAVPPRWNRIVIDCGAKVVGVKSGAATQGYAYFAVGDRAITIDVDYEARKKADLPAHNVTLTPTEVAVRVPFSDGTNTLTFLAAKAQRIVIGDGDRDEFITNPIKWACNASSGDDELTITAA